MTAVERMRSRKGLGNKKAFCSPSAFRGGKCALSAGRRLQRWTRADRRAGSVPCAHGGKYVTARAPGCAHGSGVGWGERPGGAHGGGHTAGVRGALPQCAPPRRFVLPDGERRGARLEGCANAPPPGAIKASPPAAASASNCPRSRFACFGGRSSPAWTLKPAPALLVAPAPAPTPASARAAHAPPARRAAAPAALQSVRNVPRIVCAKVERGPKLRRRSVAAASEDVPPVPCETCVNSAGWPSATCPVVSLAVCSLPCKALASDNKSYEWHKPRTGLFLKGKDARGEVGY
ncbi:skin secretory protein xP2-like [Bubalus kerabau]|uniref:skin secretory protein xP2-like n=1 Tax=Bubalus carabanensis TaxID=3119969 RepID=UPI00244EE7D4|nr:skin secretory protein xP2-like [Bubalus carabanensis]